MPATDQKCTHCNQTAKPDMRAGRLFYYCCNVLCKERGIRKAFSKQK